MGISGADGGASPSNVIDSIVNSPSMYMNWAELSGKRWLNSQKCWPLMATLKQSFWARINISRNCPREIGQPPSRSSGPQPWFSKWVRTIILWSRRMLKCKLTSSRGPNAGPVCTLISMNFVTTGPIWLRMRIIAPGDRPPGILQRCGTDWNR